jgi:predicted dehydrogenase
MSKKINVAIIGLGFGAEFIPIYQGHPNANLMAVCQRDPKKLNENHPARVRHCEGLHGL